MTASTQVGPREAVVLAGSGPVLAPKRRPKIGWAGYAFISPWLIGFLFFTLGPMVASLYLSLTDYSGLSDPEFIGTANYERMLHDPLFWQSLYNTGYYTLFSVAGTLFFAFIVALLLSTDLPGIGVFRTLFYIPVMVPAVANSLLWMLLFNDMGLVNRLLEGAGLPVFSWLGDPSMVKLVFISQSIWALGTIAMIFLAGLRDVPTTYYEAADLDGAGTLAKMRHITLPLLSPVIFFNLVILVVNSFQVFTAAYVIGSGPVNSSLFYVLYLYNNAFSYFDMGYASALAWALFVIILVFTAIQFRMARRYVHYEVSQ